MFVSEDKSTAFAEYVQMKTDPNPPMRRLKLKGLDPNRRYTELLSGVSYMGDTLMNAGINLPVMFGDGKSCIFKFIAE